MLRLATSSRHFNYTVTGTQPERAAKRLLVKLRLLEFAIGHVPQSNLLFTIAFAAD
jgi:hypothetical protein